MSVKAQLFRAATVQLAASGLKVLHPNPSSVWQE
jgi:hypothetical protein